MSLYPPRGYSPCVWEAVAHRQHTSRSHSKEKPTLLRLAPHPLHDMTGVQFLTFLVIQLTSSVTLKVLGTARNAGLVVFSFLFLGEIVSWLQGIGYSISLLAFGAYNYFHMQAPPKKTSEPHADVVCVCVCPCLLCGSLLLRGFSSLALRKMKSLRASVSLTWGIVVHQLVQLVLRRHMCVSKCVLKPRAYALEKQMRVESAGVRACSQPRDLGLNRDFPICNAGEGADDGARGRRRR